MLRVIKLILFNLKILIFVNYISNKNSIRKDKDPKLFNNEIRPATNKYNELFEQYINNGKLQINYEWFQVISNGSINSIRLYDSPFNSSELSQTYSPILNTFLSGKEFQQSRLFLLMA